MQRITCTDFEEFVASIPAVEGRYLLTKRRVRDWHLRIVDLDAVVAFQVRGGASNLFNGMSQSDHYSLYLPVSDPTQVRLCGKRFSRNMLGLIVPSNEFQLRTEAPTRWMGVHIKRRAISHRMSLGEAVAGGILQDIDVRAVSQVTFRHLVSSVRRVFAIDEGTAFAWSNPAQRAMASEHIIEALFEAITSAEDLPQRHRGRQPYERRRILERCMALIEKDASRTPSVEELCQVAFVSDRTLRQVFVDTFGMSPHRYLMVRRMHAIRAALRAAKNGETVSSICNDFGVWDFGRFAQQYRLLYGTSPSQDLKAQP